MLSMDTYRGDKSDPGTLHLYSYCANNPINFIDPSGHRKFDISKGIAYAKKWSSRNNPKYKHYSSDCTNFASQILYEGGIKFDDYWYDKKTGCIKNVKEITNNDSVNNNNFDCSSFIGISL